MVEVMLDLETMGNGPQAAIIAIGAVEFDLAKQAIGEEFYTVVDLASSVQAGGIMDASTVLWWMRQSDEARAALAVDGKHIADALLRFSHWMSSRGPKEDLKVWGNGADFDSVILSSAYQRLSLELPWTHKGNRCYRTVKQLGAAIETERAGIAHNALDDAKNQARHLLTLLCPGDWKPLL